MSGCLRCYLLDSLLEAYGLSLSHMLMRLSCVWVALIAGVLRGVGLFVTACQWLFEMSWIAFVSLWPPQCKTVFFQIIFSSPQILLLMAYSHRCLGFWRVRGTTCDLSWPLHWVLVSLLRFPAKVTADLVKGSVTHYIIVRLEVLHWRIH
mgnify:CR=1 FL=1